MKKEFLVQQNKEFFYQILESIEEEFNCSPYDIEMVGDSYQDKFVFKVPICKGWLFGFWIYPPKASKGCFDGKGNLQTLYGEWFCQHELDIDKFRPSHSCFREKCIYSVGSMSKCYDGCISSAIKFIKNHQFVAAYYDYHCADIYTRVSSIHAFLSYIGRIIQRKTDTWYGNWCNKKYVTFYKKNIIPLFGDAFIVDKGKDWVPRYDLYSVIENNNNFATERGMYFFGDDLEECFPKEYKKLHRFEKYVKFIGVILRAHYRVPIETYITILDYNRIKELELKRV